MEAKLVAKICSGQDGAIWGDYFFRFKSNGECWVYELSRLMQAGGEETEAFTTFCLDRAELLMPHSNAVSFGCEYAEEGDEFPLLYTNLYNSYAKADDKKEGVCCVYRLQRTENQFQTRLVQVIRVGFAGTPGLWRSATGRDVRPYGNFIVDRERGIYYGFTMRDEEQTTRYFSFRLPRSGEGRWDERLAARCVTLTERDVADYFDCPYHRYIQGACVHEGKIYSLEGFTDDVENPPALRVIDPAERRQLWYLPLKAAGLSEEPEWIDVSGGRYFYADHAGKVYRLLFSEKARG